MDRPMNQNRLPKHVKMPLLLALMFFISADAIAAGQNDAKSIRAEIAFLEDWCTTYSEGKEIKTKYEPRVRLAFKRSPKGWEAYDNRASDMSELKQAAKRFSGNRRWFVVDQEKPLGSLLSEGVQEYQRYADVGIQKVLGALPPATLLPRSNAFSGWLGCHVRRPFVLVSHKPTRGSDGWARKQPSYKPNTEILNLIRTSANELYSCTDERDESGTLIKARIGVDMLQTVDELVSTKGDRLFAVKFLKDACVANEYAEHENSMYWFAPVGKSQLKFLGQGLTIIDWADYDSDGETDFLFWIDGYNINGYRIVWKGLREMASFTWGYH
jgi:hypothetical protein